jgi:hypothetical protein
LPPEPCEAGGYGVKTEGMFSQSTKISAIVLAFPLIISLLANDCAQQRGGVKGQPGSTSSKMENAQTGTWGGEHIRLEVTSQGGQVEYDCAHGTIDQKIITDGQGRFDLSGTHVREHGGPIRKDEAADSHPAQFKGQIKGNTMTLTVTESDTREIVGTFTLIYGQTPRLMKCR